MTPRARELVLKQQLGWFGDNLCHCLRKRWPADGFTSQPFLCASGRSHPQSGRSARHGRYPTKQAHERKQTMPESGHPFPMSFRQDVQFLRGRWWCGDWASLDEHGHGTGSIERRQRIACDFPEISDVLVPLTSWSSPNLQRTSPENNTHGSVGRPFNWKGFVLVKRDWQAGQNCCRTSRFHSLTVVFWRTDNASLCYLMKSSVLFQDPNPLSHGRGSKAVRRAFKPTDERRSH